MKPQILIYFDFICPYSHILRKYIRKMEKDLKADIVWKSFELYPPHKIKPKKGTEYYKDLQKNTQQISKLFKTKMKFNGNFSRTRLIHEVYKYAKDKGKGQKFLDVVFKAYHDKGKNIEKLDVVLNLAKQVKIDTADLLSHLDQFTFLHEIHKDEADARAMGVRGTPTIRIGKYQLYGILEYAELKKTLKEMLKKSTPKKAKKAPKKTVKKKTAKSKKPSKKITKKKIGKKSKPKTKKVAKKKNVVPQKSKTAKKITKKKPKTKKK